MSETALLDRIEQLESRLMHLEASIEELTDTLLEQERQAGHAREVIKALEDRVRDLSDRPVAQPADPPPPHY